MRRILAKLFTSLLALPEWLVGDMPGPAGYYLRTWYWRRRMRHVGGGVTFGRGVRISGPKWISIGDNSWIDDDVALSAGPANEQGRVLTRKPNASFSHDEGALFIGMNCHIAPQVTIQAHGGVSIGNDSGVASGCRIYSLSHHYRNARDPKDLRIYKFTPRAAPEWQSLILSPVVMEDSSALATNCVVLPGATIGSGTWVGCLSLVIGRLPPGVQASGQPAKPKKAIGIDGGA